MNDLAQSQQADRQRHETNAVDQFGNSKRESRAGGHDAGADPAKQQAQEIHTSLDTQIAMVEAGEGIAVIPSYGLPVCRSRRVVMSRLINPTVTLDFHLIRNRGRKLPACADEFTGFLQGFIARWAGSAGVL